jgi:clan AA aspartic protease
MLLPTIKSRARRVRATELATTANKGDEMGLVYADIELISGDDLALYRRGYIKEVDIKRISVRALVDSGAYTLAINQRLKEQLGLMALGTQGGELADGTQVEMEVAGPVEIRFANRRAIVDALVLPNESGVLLGAIPMEEMDVLIDPKQEKLIPNPQYPDLAQGVLK